MDPDPDGARSVSRGPPLSVPPERRELFGRLYDPEHMLAVFRRELPPLADATIRVASCSVRPDRKKAFRKGQIQLVFRVGIAVESAPEREFVLLGVCPVAEGFPGRELEERCRKVQGHPAAAPFRELAARVDELELGLFFFPMDPALPGLAEITGPRGARLLASFLPECRSGAKLERIECELRHYKPFNRVVLRVRASLSGPLAREAQRSVYVKVFYGDHGAVSYRELASLWNLAQRTSFLRVPEPLGYDPEHRLLVMSEVPGRRYLTEWVHRIRKGELPPAGDMERLHRCLFIAANGLRELQGSGLRPEARSTFQDELSNLRKVCASLHESVRQGHPELLARVGTLLRRLEALAPVDEPLVPSHGEYRHQQMIGDERSLTLIDWDGFCLANPALDAARLLARLRREALSPPGSPELERMAETFRREFLAPRPEISALLDLYEGLHLTTYALHSFVRSSRGEETVREIGALATAAEQLLDRAEQR